MTTGQTGNLSADAGSAADPGATADAGSAADPGATADAGATADSRSTGAVHEDSFWGGPPPGEGKRVGQSVGLVLVCDCDRGCRPTLVDRPLQFQTCCGTMAFKFLNSLTRITNIESAVGPEPEWTNRDLTYRDKGPVRFVARGRQSLANG